jgi:hypothetical protein
MAPASARPEQKVRHSMREAHLRAVQLVELWRPMGQGT